MNLTERDLRERYRSASDEELQDLIALGRDAYTPTAWRLLNEETAGRRLPAPPPGWWMSPRRAALALGPNF